MERGKKWDLFSVASIPLIMTLGNSMLIPVLPALRSRLGVSPLGISMIITVYSAVAIVLIPVAGFLSDRFGRKIVIVPSLLLAGAGGLVSGLAAWWMEEPYAVMLLGRLLQGIGAAGAAPIVLPLVGDMFRSERDVSSGMGLVETANTFGKVLSPIVGSALAAWLWFVPFLAIPVFCLISVVMIVVWVKPSSSSSSHNPGKEGGKMGAGSFWRSVKAILRQKGRWLYAIFAIGGICMFVIFGSLFYLSDVLEERFRLHGVIKGCVLAIPLAALCLVSYVSGRSIGKNKKRMKWMTFAGLAVLSASVLCGGFAQAIGWLIAWLCLAGVGIGAALPCLDAMITEGIEQKERGTISSLYSSMRFIGVALGPPAASLLVRLSPPAMFAAMAGVCAVAAVLALLAIRPRQAAGRLAQQPK